MSRKREFTVVQATRDEWLAQLPLREYFVDHGATDEGMEALRCALEGGGERDIQSVLERHPRFLVQRLASGMGWVIPQKRLGSEFVTDFLIAEDLSSGIYWQAVELESPRVRMFTKNGDPSRFLVHAIRQIQDWRSWLESNQSYASRSRNENGLGLVEISPRLPGLILIGRRQETSPKTNGLRRQMMSDLRIEIRSFDSLLDTPERIPLYVRFGDFSWA